MSLSELLDVRNSLFHLVESLLLLRQHNTLLIFITIWVEQLICHTLSCVLSLLDRLIVIGLRWTVWYVILKKWSHFSSLLGYLCPVFNILLVCCFSSFLIFFYLAPPAITLPLLYFRLSKKHVIIFKVSREIQWKTRLIRLNFLLLVLLNNKCSIPLIELKGGRIQRINDKQYTAKVNISYRSGTYL